MVQPSQQVLLHNHSLPFSLEGRCGEGAEVLVLSIKSCLLLIFNNMYPYRSIQTEHPWLIAI